MTFYAIAALINTITSLTLGLIVLIKNKKNTTNIMFALLSLAVFIWSLFYFFWQISTNYNNALLFTRILSIGSTLIPIFYLHWVFSFLEVKDKKNLFILYLGYAATFVFLMFSFSPLFVRDVEPIGIFKFWPKAGILYTIYLAYYVILVGYGLIRLLRSYAQTSGIKRSQISFIIFGTILGFFGGATNFLLWYDVMVYPIGNIMVSFYVFMLFYAMAKYRLMDTRIVARKFFVYSCIAAFVYIFFYFLIWFYTHLFGGLFNQISYFIGFIIAPTFVFVFYKVDGAIKNFANRYLFVSLYNYQETINQLIDELTNYIDLNEISELLVAAIKKSVQSQSIVIFLAETKDNSLKYSKFKIGELNTTVINSLPEGNILIKYLSKNHKSLVQEELVIFSKEAATEKERNEFKKIYVQMERLDASLCLPLISNNKLIGLIILGRKISGDLYTEEDLRLLDLLSKQAGIAIENARQYQQIQLFGETLQKKVEEQTKDISEKNKYLKKVAQEETLRKEEAERISKLKSEFISIASHQLRTPLAAIRGYTSMLKDNDFGKIPVEAKKAVDYIHESSIGMIKLVNSLLSVSRLEKGKIELKLQKTSVESLVEECIKDVELLAKGKNLYLKYEKPKTALPNINADPEKLKQAISNIINNACLYTVEGGVTITILTKGDNIIIQVKDTGVGIEKEDFEKIFKSFSRGKGGTELYTQGTGLGLYVAKNFVEMHNGKLYVKSEGKNKGSTFTFELPIQGAVEVQHDFKLVEEQ